MQLSELLNKYMSLETDINNMNKDLKKKREEKSELSNVIMKYMKQKNIDKLNDKYNNCFCIKENKTYSSISQTLLKDTLYSYFSEKKTEADSIIKCILNNRKQTIDNNLIIKPNK